MQDAEHLQLIRSLKGPPAVILVLLMLRGASMTNLEICRFTGYSDKPVKTALAVLETLAFVQNNGHFNGWSLSSGIRQLPLPLGVLSELSTVEHPSSSAPTPPAGVKAGNSSPQLSTELSTSRQQKIGNIPILGVEDRKYSDLEGEDRKYSDLRAGSGSAAAADLRSLRILDQQQQQRGGEDRKNSDLQRLVIHSSIREPARTLLLGAPPVAALAWWWAALLARRELANPLGWFIRRIQGGEPAPVSLAPIAAAWLALPAVARRELLATEWYEDEEAFWLAHGLGPTMVELAHEVGRAGGFDYGEW